MNYNEQNQLGITMAFVIAVIFLIIGIEIIVEHGFNIWSVLLHGGLVVFYTWRTVQFIRFRKYVRSYRFGYKHVAADLKLSYEDRKKKNEKDLKKMRAHLLKSATEVIDQCIDSLKDSGNKVNIWNTHGLRHKFQIFDEVDTPLAWCSGSCSKFGLRTLEEYLRSDVKQMHECLVTHYECQANKKTIKNNLELLKLAKRRLNLFLRSKKSAVGSPKQTRLLDTLERVEKQFRARCSHFEINAGFEVSPMTSSFDYKGDPTKQLCEQFEEEAKNEEQDTSEDSNNS